MMTIPTPHSCRLLLFTALVWSLLALGLPAAAAQDPAPLPLVEAPLLQSDGTEVGVAQGEELVLRLYNLQRLARMTARNAAENEAADLLSKDAPEDRRKALIEILLEEKLKQEAEQVGALIRKHVTPPWASAQQHMMADARGTLGVLASAAQHQWIEDFLALQEREDLTVEVRTAVIEFPTTACEENALLQSAPVVQGGGEANFLESLKAVDGAELVTEPRLMVYPGTLATLTIGNQVAYIRNWELETVFPGPVQIADPVIDTVQTGLLLEVRPALIGDARLDLQLRFDQADLIRMETTDLQLSPDSEAVKVNHPVVQSHSLSTNLVLNDGGQALLPVATDEDGRASYLVVSVRVVVLPDSKEKASEEEGDQ